MPTLDELGQKVKAKYPGTYDDVSDRELGQKVKEKYPDAYSDFSGFSKPKGQTAAQRESKRRIANIGVEQAAADQKQGDINAKTKFAGQMAEALPFAAAAPFTGGMALLPALGTMAAAGAAGGALREGIKATGGSNEIPKSMGDLALTLGIDAATGAAGEGLGRGIGAVGKTLLPKLIVRSAAKAAQGRALLEDAFVQTRNKLYQTLQGATGVAPKIDIEPALQTAYDSLAHLPRAGGQFGQRFGGMTPAGKEIVSAIESDLLLTGGSVANMQPLDGIIRAKSSLQRAAWQESGLSVEEKNTFKSLANDLDKEIKKGLVQAGPEAQTLYQKSQDLMILERKRDLATDFAETAIRRLGGKAVVGGLVGGGAGYEKGGIGGAIKGAAAGAAVGAAAAATPRLSSLVLEQAMSHPEAVKILGKALDFAVKGEKGRASELALRAFVVAGARNTIKEAIRQNPDQP